LFISSPLKFHNNEIFLNSVLSANLQWHDSLPKWKQEAEKQSDKLHHSTGQVGRFFEIGQKEDENTCVKAEIGVVDRNRLKNGQKLPDRFASMPGKTGHGGAFP